MLFLVMDSTTTAREAELLHKLVRSGKIRASAQRRLRVIFERCVWGKSRAATADTYGFNLPFVDRWYRRWIASQAARFQWAEAHPSAVSNDRLYADFLVSLVEDHPRSGVPAKFGPEVREKVIALALTYPPDLGLPFERWSHRLLSLEVVKRGIAPQISSTRVGDFLKGAPHATPSQ